MSRFNIDYSNLNNKINKRVYKLSDVKDKIEKVAFDVVRFSDDDSGANLWQVQSADDGEYIVAKYQDDISVEKTSAWSVSVIKTAGEIEISYKGDPIVRLASSKLGIPNTELNKVKNYLPSKLAENKKLVKSLLKELPETAKNAVLSKYPELV